MILIQPLIFHLLHYCNHVTSSYQCNTTVKNTCMNCLARRRLIGINTLKHIVVSQVRSCVCSPKIGPTFLLIMSDRGALKIQSACLFLSPSLHRPRSLSVSSYAVCLSVCLSLSPSQTKTDGINVIPKKSANVYTSSVLWSNLEKRI